jgi:hypothetical protein
MGRPKAIHHVSSIAVFDAEAYRGRRITESTRPLESRGIHLPYAQCKWVSEALVWQAAALGIPVTVHRPSLVSGASSDGAWNTADFLCRMLIAVIEMGCMPGDLDIQLDFSPVDYVSRAVIHLSRTEGSASQAFHLLHPQGIALREFGHVLRSLGHGIEFVPYRDWVDRIGRRPRGTLYPLFPFLRQRWRPQDLSYIELGQRRHRPEIHVRRYGARAGAGRDRLPPRRPEARRSLPRIPGQARIPTRRGSASACGIGVSTAGHCRTSTNVAHPARTVKVTVAIAACVASRITVAFALPGNALPKPNCPVSSVTVRSGEGASF